MNRMSFYFDQFEARTPPLPLRPSVATELVWQFLAIVALVLGAWYLEWRWTSSLNWHAMWFSLPLAIAETGAYAGLCLYVFNLWHTQDPRASEPPATLNECLAESIDEDRPISVDVFVTTYNENPELVRLSIRDACAMTYPHSLDLRVHVLDDGNREAMRRIADEEGAIYISRTDNIGFKAGNLRHALAQTSGDFILICDADTRPFPTLLAHTLGYFSDPLMAWVQTPQWFYDVPEGLPLGDILGHRMGGLGRLVARGIERLTGPTTIGADPFVTDASMFYDVILRRRCWANAVFCCGAASVHRREAITETALRGYVQSVSDKSADAMRGWFRRSHDRRSDAVLKATITHAAAIEVDYTPYKFHVSEDIYTSLILHGDIDRRWKSCLHPQVESRMLSPQDLLSWTVQRFKYAAGSLDILMHDNPLFRRGLSLPQRLMYGATFMSYLGGLWNVAFLLAPIIYLATGVAPVAAYEGAFLFRILPFLVCLEFASIAGTWGIAGYRSKASYLAFFWLNLRALAMVVQGKPIRFPVTPKERQAGLHMRLVAPHLALIAMTLCSAAYAIFAWSTDRGDYTATGLLANIFWGLSNIAGLSILVRAAFHAPRCKPEDVGPVAAIPKPVRARRTLARPALAAACASALAATPMAASARDLFGVSIGGSTVGVEKHPGRNGPLSPKEMRMAEAAWSYFAAHTEEKTGLANAVGDFPSTTMWDTASYVSALVSARELGIIDKQEFDRRTIKLLATLRDLDLFRGELPNKVYHTKTGAKVAYNNAPGEVGYSGMDVGRLLIWLKIVQQRYPYLANAADNVALKWNYCNVVSDHGYLHSAGVNPKTGATTRFREGRLGYEEYAAKGYGLWGFKTTRASRAYPFEVVEINGIKVPYDARDPRTTGQSNYVLSEAYLLEGIELNFDRPDDTTSSPMVHSDGWRAEFSAHVYMAQQLRFEKQGILTARTEHQVEGSPYFVYDSVFADGYPWNTQDPKGVTHPERAAIATKGALSMWALYDTPYSDELFDAVADLYVEGKGFDEGIYENGSGTIPLQTANNNGIILAALLYKVQGPLLKRLNPGSLLWNTAFKYDDDVRQSKCLPDERPLDDCVECGTKEKPEVPADIFKFCNVTRGRKGDGELESVAVRDCKPDPYRNKILTAKALASAKAKDDCPEKKTGSKSKKASVTS